MFSDQLKKIDEIPSSALMGVAAGLVFVCQLAALVLVLNGQVEKAHLREAHYNSAQVEIADFNSPSTFTPETKVQAANQPSQQTDASPSAANIQGYLQTTFTNRQ